MSYVFALPLLVSSYHNIGEIMLVDGNEQDQTGMEQVA